MKEVLQPKVLVLKTDGTNCDAEMNNAFNKAHGNSAIVHVNELRSKEKRLSDYDIIGLPGGFSYGDDIKSGKILAIELTAYLGDQINDFISHGGLVLGVCNGFQVLVRTGLLPFGVMGEMKATLTDNDSGKFECRPVNLRVEDSKCVFMKDAKGEIITYPVAHGEGKFYAKQAELEKVENEKLVIFRYADTLGNPTQQFPQNPNGSLNAIAGICDPSGRILGLMPHPERAVEETQYENWRRQRAIGQPIRPEGLRIFENMINYIKQM
ncbi:MAG: phosphoribosylformylglycinamidine synthase I [Candidatus Levybacteria bacterium]|nr:phosphoribosylformylglycinamidine synthase I [Candidatus Levybacteria bacterium]MDZ4228543.1 phosphoribosylformylglycinamidine synthase I [Candidatus Levybacteria bacterium]